MKNLDFQSPLQIMDIEKIKTIGYLLTSYAGDLNYFATFIRFSKDEISPDAYARKEVGTFKNFINEYRVARNTKRDLTADLLACSLDWHQKGRTKDVDDFAQMIQAKGLTHGKVATSLSSKIMYLMNPWEVMPLDDLAKKALDHRNKDYKGFATKIQRFRLENEKDIHQTLDGISGMLDILERPFVETVGNLEKIRENRFIDKWLWVRGGKK